MQRGACGPSLFKTEIKMHTKTGFSTYEVAVTVFLACWFLATILCQFRDTKLSTFIRGRLDLFAMIPLWTFFAPKPGKRDYHLLYRDRDEPGTLTEWQEMEITEERRF